jgi:hypothetical protein
VNKRIEILSELSLFHMPGLVKSLAVDLQNPDFDKLELNLTNLNFIYPSALTVLSTFMFNVGRFGIPLTIYRPKNDDVHNYLTRMDFYEIVNIQIDFPWNQYGSQGRFREVIKLNNEREGDQVVSELINILDHQMDIAGIHNAINHSFVEIVNNVFHHAQSPTNAIICAQSYNKKRWVEISVVDSGIGIPTSLKANPKIQFSSSQEAIEQATKPRVTGKPGKNTGEGLFWSLEFLKRNGGNGWIYSHDGAARIVNGNVNYGQYTPWLGTIVAMRFNMDNPINTEIIFNQFAPPENDFEWLFEEQF